MIKLNEFVGSGNCGRDAELYRFPSGASKLSYSLAMEKSRRLPDGSWENVPIWIDCEQYFSEKASDIASKLMERIRKGKRIVVKGELDYQSWDDKATGSKRSKNLINVNSIQFEETGSGGGGSGGGGGRSAGSYGGSGGSRSSGGGRSTDTHPNEFESHNDEIPF